MTAKRPPRLKAISIQDFRGFPGQHNPPIELDGKNLLIYGENGAGKSTIFKALDYFFSIEEKSKTARAKLLADSAHIFTDENVRAPSVEMTFTDNISYRWDANSHPNDPIADSRIFAASYRKGMLDYRSLLDLSYRYLGKKLDLFPACMSVLLRDLRISHGGSERRLRRLWQDTLSEYERYHFQRVRDQIENLLTSINAGLRLALPRIQAETATLLSEMLHDELQVTDLEFTGLAFRWAYHRPDRRITGQSILPEIQLRGEPIASPHTFLNEARVSALAIALYLAGRKICGETLQADTPKLLVLDDLLIGLDQSNRLPVLDALTKHFGLWQIILLTHDRVWFEMARIHLPDSGKKAWTSIEMFEGLESDGKSRPVLRPINQDVVAENLRLAQQFLDDHYDHASAVHTRMAFEQSLKRFCERKGVRVRFQSDPRRLTTDDLLGGVEKWLDEAKGLAHRAALVGPIKDVKTARKVIINPFSHSTPVTLVKAEVQSAIDAVTMLDNSLSAI